GDSDASSLVFAPDGRRVATGLTDTSIVLWDVTGSRAETPPDLDALWADLASTDAAKAYTAAWSLIAAPGPATALLATQLRPAASADGKRLDELIAALDSDEFAAREKAFAELKKLEALAEPALRRALAAKPAPEARKRLEALLADLDGVPAAETLRQIRAVFVLEQIHSPAARQLLEELAGGAAGARLTQEAMLARARLT